MVTMVTEKRVLNWREAEAEFDGCWFLLDKRGFPLEDDMGYLVAYGDGTPEDRDALTEIKFSNITAKYFWEKDGYPKMTTFYTMALSTLFKHSYTFYAYIFNITGKDTVILVLHIGIIDKERLIEKISKTNKDTMKKIAVNLSKSYRIPKVLDEF
jgi:hypothetical protein